MEDDGSGQLDAARDLSEDLEIGVLIYDEDDYVSDSTKTEKFEIVEEIN